MTTGPRALSGEALDLPALNRATLARQHLLARSSITVDEEVGHLVGMQAQVPGDPYVALWTRLSAFDPEDLSRSLTERRTVRMTLMRGTIHLATAADALVLRPIVQPVLERLFHRGTVFGRAVAGMDLDALLKEGRRLLEEQPRTAAELRRLLQERWPGRDPQAMTYAVRYIVPLVQVTPRGVWGARHQATFTTLEAWLGEPLHPSPSADQVVLRYLAAYGPASVTDARAWSGVTGLRPVFERLRERLVTFRSDTGRELFDLPDAPRPDPETPARAIFLPTFDNVLLSHADRRRFYGPRGGPASLADGSAGSFLLDGLVAGRWRDKEAAGTAMLSMRTFAAPVAADRARLVEEAERLVRFLRPAAARHEVTLTASD